MMTAAMLRWATALLVLSLSAEQLHGMEGHLYRNFKANQKYQYDTKYYTNRVRNKDAWLSGALNWCSL